MVPGSSTMNEDAQGHFDLSSRYRVMSLEREELSAGSPRETPPVSGPQGGTEQEDRRERWRNVHVLKVVLNGGHAYEIANKCRVWEHDPGHGDEYVKLLNDAMVAWSSVTISLVLEHYDGFKDVKKLVDGGLGMCMGKIVEKYPHIEGANFDLPHTVEIQPFPSTLLNFSDEDCLKMLANCNKARPRGGKMIVVDLMYSKDGAGPTPTVARPGDLKNTWCCLKKVALATFPS
ncbi:xanthohumol 4-O-methyltransferase [Selaginella moellendorffii]|uniref:xanthohumol 4-O-methyltransferase n=1 Tax=Selaginella moellendorffii TaxID=88036 RepID=UPI000D1C935A|nr:xanthohumol 4-O-methyltransferase [Selaginella moellendorffii]|eukprot:XP_024521126.1 xanthohumol 4-O-methyltransferase [Selaginella moellendorffii]